MHDPAKIDEDPLSHFRDRDVRYRIDRDRQWHLRTRIIIRGIHFHHQRIIRSADPNGHIQRFCRAFGFCHQISERSGCIAAKLEPAHFHRSGPGDETDLLRIERLIRQKLLADLSILALREPIQYIDRGISGRVRNLYAYFFLHYQVLLRYFTLILTVTVLVPAL